MKKRFAVIGIIAGLICAGVGIYQYVQEQNAGKEYEAIREQAEKNPEPQNSKEPIQIPIDFQTLQQQNPEVYAWIRIPGTVIDYPVVQSETDDTYYLNHASDRTDNAAGAIFTEKSYNSRDFEDPNTLIYGHGMTNGSMFRGLHQYMDRSFFDGNREVTIYTPDAIRHYRIFAAYIYDDRHILQSFDFENKVVYQQYLDEIFSVRGMTSFVDQETEVTADDKIITLSTCYAGPSDTRYLVQAVLVSIEK